MADRYELASAIFGTKRAETDASNLSSAIITGTAVEDSEEGVVKIVPDGNVIAPDGEDNTIILPTSPNVKEGDNVIIISTGGTATTPIVTGASGSGDRIVSELNTLLTDVEGIETLIRETTDGVLVAKVGQTVGALVNADGSFDVVEITGWNDGVPTVGNTLGLFSQDSVKFSSTDNSGSYSNTIDTLIGNNGIESYNTPEWSDEPLQSFVLYPGTSEGGTAQPYVLFGNGELERGLGAKPYLGGLLPQIDGDYFEFSSGGARIIGIHPNGLWARYACLNGIDATDDIAVYDTSTADIDHEVLPSVTIGKDGNVTITGEFTGAMDWSNIVNAPSMHGGVLFGKVDATSTATAFTATVEGLDALVDGAAVYLTNGVVTSAADFTININNLGAKPVYTNLAAATAETTKFNINYSMLFIYNSQRVTGGCWDCYNGYDSNTNTIGYQLRTNSGTMVAADKGYRYRLWFTSTDGSKWVPANTSTSTNATANRTLNQRPIDPFGAIVYYSTNGTTNAGAALAATTQWQQYTLTIGYSYMQSGFSLTANEPVYVQCTPQSDGSAIMNSIVQALPTTDDGKIYIFLGIAYSATNLELRAEHPVYYFKDGAVRPWTNQLTTTMDAATNADILAIFS